MTGKPSVLIIAPHGSYRTMPFIAAAERLGIHALIASEGKHSIVSAYAQGIHVDFQNETAAFTALLQAARVQHIVGVIGTDDATTELAARLAQHLELPHNDPVAVSIARRKDHARTCLAAHQVPVPAFRRLDLSLPIAGQVEDLSYPVVIKPVALSASRGVIRANNTQELFAAIQRVQQLLQNLSDLDLETGRYLLIEQYIHGEEIAVEAMLSRGELHILTIFDKPDLMEGPFFEETYYTTPTRHNAGRQRAITHVVQQACDAYGLREGPVHAECRLNKEGVFILEVAARTIGGLCGRLLRFGTGYSLEELVLAQAMGKPLALNNEQGAAGVLMIPIPKAGMLKRVEGMLEAQRVPYIEDINIQVREGHELVPLPEGASYLGFIFARAPDVQQAERALRDAHAKLQFVIAPIWKLDQGTTTWVA
ncbi:MAG: ATP-grasp domain-containing protein [Gammaproteobacteria bacterium]|nr:ATP-grasp domain-containing protein [Gammaproteobacteria bacterium]